MLASPLTDKVAINPGEWCGEPKLDGHRLIVAVAADGGDLFGNSVVQAWSRNAIPRILPAHVRRILETLPSGIFDGELHVPGKRSYGVTELVNTSSLAFTLFDCVELVGRDCTGCTYDERRSLLLEIGRQREIDVIQSTVLESKGHAMGMAEEVWSHDGEGVILKRRSSLYKPGKRVKEWVKIKQLRSATLTLVGYAGGQMGPHSVMVLLDDEGQGTTVKWKNLAQLAEADADPKRNIGRRCLIEFQELTNDGSYRHPRFDRWEDE